MVMTKKKKSIFLLLSLPLLIIAVFAISISVHARAEEAPAHSFKIAHLTDIHVFDKSLANKNSIDFQKAENALALLYDSEAAFITALETIKKQNPDYLIVSGDLTADGGRSSHELVAERLREVQSEMRQTNPSFQIFVIPGNHDLYNIDARCYSPSEDELAGKTNEEKQAIKQNYRSRMAMPITNIDFYEIYQGLGYGSSTLGEIHYFYESECFYDCGNSDYKVALPLEEPTDDEIELQKSEPTAFDKATRAGGLSYIVKMPDGFTLVALDSTRLDYTSIDAYSSLGDSAARFGHWTFQTAGDISHEQLKWTSDILSTMGEPTLLVGTAHHSLVPHTDMQDDITTRFIVADYRTADYVLADLGVRYFFTGHVHANDIASYVSQKGNILYDFETASTVCYGASSRLVKFDIFANEAEKVYDSVFAIESIPGVDDLVSELDARTKSMEKLLSRSYLNDDLVSELKKKVESLNGKTIAKVFSVSDVTVDLLQNLIDSLFSLDLKKPEINGEAYSFSSTPTIGYHLLDFVKDLESYLFNMDVSLGKIDGGYKMIDFARELYRLNLVGAESTSLSPSLVIVSECLLSGELPEKLMQVALDFLIPQLEILFDAPISLDTPVETGKGFDLSVYPKQYETISGMEIGKTALKIMETNSVTSLRTLFMALNEITKNSLVKTILSSIDSSAVSKVISYAGKVTSTTQLKPFLEENFFDKYFTKALFINLGNYANDIVCSYALDNTPDGTLTERNGEIIRYSYATNKLLTFTLFNGSKAWSGEYTYNGVLSNEENPPSKEDGRIPEMISIAYGENPYREINIKWFTRPQLAIDSLETTKSYIRYWSNSTEAKTLLSHGETVELTIPEIDLGVLYLTSTKVEYEMHTATIVIDDFNEGERIYFSVGNEQDGWSKTGSFKKKAKNGVVQVLAFSDIQGSVEANYLQSLHSAEIALDKVPDADFIISAGDNVDKEDNTHQWSWLLSHNENLFSNYVLVGASGNHEDGSFAMDTYLAAPGGELGSCESGYYYSFDMESAHFIVLNTNDLSSTGKLSSAQSKWLERDLKNVENKWKIVIMHKGPYTAGSHAFDDDVKALRTSLAPLFAKYGVSLVLEGHDHTYSVSEFIGEAGTPVNASTDALGRYVSPEGVLYVNLGTLGDKFYDYLYSESVFLKNRSNEGHFLSSPLGAYMTKDMKLELVGAPTFASLSVTEEGIKFLSYAIVNEKSLLIDEIEIVKEGIAIEIPEFSFKWETNLKIEHFTSDDAKLQDVVSFFKTESDGTCHYYKGYSIGEFTKEDYITIEGESYLASSAFVAIYETDHDGGEYARQITGKRHFPFGL